MFEPSQTDLEPAWAERMWYGSVFGCFCVLGAAYFVLSWMKHGNFRFLVGGCGLAVFALALHSFVIGMRTQPPSKQLSVRMRFLALLLSVPWIVLLFLK
jgi:hypothetical protein